MSRPISDLNRDRYTVAVVGSFDCKCGGRVCVKRYIFNNKWKRPNADGKVTHSIFRYYGFCNSCGEVVGWRFTPQDVKRDYEDGKHMVGKFDRNGTYVVSDPYEEKVTE